MDSIIQGIAIYALPVIFAITLHEAAPRAEVVLVQNWLEELTRVVPTE